MKIIILGGFLGSGKTTVLMQLAKYLVSSGTGSNPCEVVILENEIGQVGVDNQLLSSSNFQVENIFSGCVCCSSSGQLCSSILDIQEKYNPGWLILETTGIAYPDKTKEVIESELHLPSAILAIADAKRWPRLIRSLKAFVESQLSQANVILLNKIDLADEQTRLQAADDIRSINPSAALYEISAIQPQPETLWQQVSEQLSLSLEVHKNE